MQARPIRIAVCAEAFGFGPASKAAAILSRLSQDRPIEVLHLTCSIAHEFLLREGYQKSVKVDIHFDRADWVIPLLDEIDLALLVLIPDWLPVFSGRVPVAYVDSLGFMWPAAYYDTYPLLRDVEAYFVQDVFGAVERVLGNGVRKVKPVGALTRFSPSTSRSDPAIIHLGGGINIFSPDDGPFYAAFVARLLDGLVRDGTLLLTSRAVRDARPELLAFKSQTLSHDDTMKRFANASMVFTAPGLTALLELAATQAPIIPLPPQNFSQAVIVREMAAVKGAPQIWQLLADFYPISTNAPEQEGVARVRALNLHYSQTGAFWSAYRNAAQQEIASPRALPEGFVSKFNGLDQVAAHISEMFAST